MVDLPENKALGGLRQGQHGAIAPGAVASFERQVTRVPAQQSDCEGNHHRLLVGLSGRRRHGLREIEAVASGVRIIVAGRDHFRRSGLRVPEHELGEIDARDIGKALHELLHRGGLSVVTAEIKIHAAAKFIRAEQRLEHAHRLGAFLIDGRRIEVIDLVILRRPHRMSERTGILVELVRPQCPHIPDALNGARAHVGCELLVAKHREPFLEAKLEPVATGDAISRPVVKVFVCHDRFDTVKIPVGRRFRRREYVFVVEDVETLVFHRSHVEVGNRNDHETIEIVLASEAGFVPAHGALEGVHGMTAAGFVARLDIDAQRHVTPGHGAEAVLDTGKFSADHGEQIGWLGERIVPDRVVRISARDFSALHEIAVRQQHRRFVFVRFDAGRVHRHHVGTIHEIGDATKALGFALRAVDRSGAIKTHQLSVGGRIDERLNLQPERPRRRLCDGQLLRCRGVLLGGQSTTIERNRAQIERVAIEDEGCGRSSVRAQHQGCTHAGRLRVERDVELDRFHQPIGRVIVGQANRASLIGAHGEFRL